MTSFEAAGLGLHPTAVVRPGYPVGGLPRLPVTQMQKQAVNQKTLWRPEVTPRRKALFGLQKPPDGVGGGLLHRRQDVAITVQSDLGGSMAVALAHHLRVHPGQQGDGCGCMPKVVKRNLR